MQNLTSATLDTTGGAQAAYPKFSATLLPHFYLPPASFCALLLNMAALSYLSVFVLFFLSVRWLGLLWCLDAALCYSVYLRRYAPRHLSEKIVLTEEKLSVIHTDPSGRAESWDFNPYWIRFEHRRGQPAGGELLLSSHGRDFAFGAFLSGREKADFAAAFGTALALQRSAARGAQSGQSAQSSQSARG